MEGFGQIYLYKYMYSMLRSYLVGKYQLSHVYIQGPLMDVYRFDICVLIHCSHYFFGAKFILSLASRKPSMLALVLF